MATSIERNTRKIIEGKLDALFATQQKLNNNFKGPKGLTGMEVDGPGSSFISPLRVQPRDMVNNLVQSDYPSYGTVQGWDQYNFLQNPIANYNYTGGNPIGKVNNGIKSADDAVFDLLNNPYIKDSAIISASKPGPIHFSGNQSLTEKAGFNPNYKRNTTSNTWPGPTSRPGNELWYTPPSNLTKDPATIAAANSQVVKDNGIATPFIQRSTMSKIDPGIKTDPSMGYGITSNYLNRPGGQVKAPGLVGMPNYEKTVGKQPDSTDTDNFDWGKAGNFAMQAAPAIYNMIKGLQKPQKVVPNYNPYESSARRLMANRRYDINPLLQDNRTNQAIMNRNIRSAANSRGELMSNLSAAQNARASMDARAWSQKNNIDNQYLAEQAQMDASLGSQRSQMDWMTQDANARNLAATNQFLGQGLQDISNMSQTREQMANQRLRDAQLLKIYPDMFKNTIGFMPGVNELIKGFNG